VTVLSAGDDGSLRVTIDTTRFEEQMRFAPTVVYYRMRRFLMAAFGKHRQQWLRQKGTRFGRGSDPRSIRVFKVNEGPATPGPNQVVYHVRPGDERRRNPAAAEAGLQAMVAEAFTDNEILPVHEFGTDIRTSRFMAIPVKTRPGNIEDWKRANPDKRLEFRPSKTKAGEGVLYEVQRKRKRGRPKKGEAPQFTEKLRLRFILTRFVKMKPTLRMYASWEGLESYRRQAFSITADGIVEDIQAGRHLQDLLRGDAA